jgi:hypothetical protein
MWVSIHEFVFECPSSITSVFFCYRLEGSLSKRGLQPVTITRQHISIITDTLACKFKVR